jgi:hypothetical protein
MADVLGFLLLAYIIACSFFDLGLLIGLNPNVGTATLMGNVQTLISASILPMTSFALAIFIGWSLEVYLAIFIVLLLFGIFYPFRRTLGAGVAAVSGMDLNPVLKAAMGLFALLAAFGLLLWISKFPDLSPGLNPFIVRALGAVLLVGSIWFGVSFVRSNDAVASTFGAIMVMWTFMLIPLQIGLYEGTRFHLRPAAEQAELANGTFLTGRTVLAVPGGIIFVEHQDSGRRETSFLSGEHVLKIGGLPPEKLAKQPKVTVRTKNLLCEFVELWTRGVVNYCESAKPAAALTFVRTGALTISPDGELVHLSADDPRAADAISLEGYERLLQDAAGTGKSMPLEPDDRTPTEEGTTR